MTIWAPGPKAAGRHFFVYFVTSLPSPASAEAGPGESPRRFVILLHRRPPSPKMA